MLPLATVHDDIKRIIRQWSLHAFASSELMLPDLRFARRHKAKYSDY
jgi:hypothetical protein